MNLSALESVAQSVAMLLIVLSGFFMMLRSLRVALTLFLAAIVVICVTPLVSHVSLSDEEEMLRVGTAIHGLLPWWAKFAAAVVLALIALRVLLSAMLGRKAADQALGRIAGTLILDFLRLFVRVPAALAKLVLRLLG